MTIITSSIMKRAHSMTKEDRLHRKDLDYRTQLGLNLSFILKQENAWSTAIKAKIAFYKEVISLAKDITTKRQHEILNKDEIVLLVTAILVKYNIDLWEDMKRYSNVSISNIASETYEAKNNIDKRLRLGR